MLNTEQNTVSTLDDDKKSGASGCSLVKKYARVRGVGEGYDAMLACFFVLKVILCSN